jgi:hypothetical protein
MSSLKQIEANRLNAQKSTGPRSVEGKAATSQNALKSGIDAESLIIRGEKQEDLETLTAEYLARFNPRTPEERHYVDSLIRDDWQLRRLAKADTQIWDHTMKATFKLADNAPLGHAFERADKTFIRLQRRIDATHRSYNTALRELQRLQAEQPADPSRDREGAVNSLADPLVSAGPPEPAIPAQPTENMSSYHLIGLVPTQLPDGPQVPEPAPNPQSPIPFPASDPRLPAPEPAPNLHSR